MSRGVTLRQVEVRLAQALDRAADRAAVVEEYVARFPEFAAGIREYVRLEDQVRAALTPPPRRLEAGDRLGEFVIVRSVGAGGMGEVYEARQDRLGRSVALKVIRRGLADKGVRDRFDREQQALARLHHTHIVPVHTAGEDGDIQFFAMAFLPGRSLKRLIRETDACDFRAVADTLARVADAVQHAHDAGVWHLDLKPSNVIVDPAGHAWVIDFGLAHLLDGGPADGGPAGTWATMAPEQHDGKPEARSDVWGLGATLYEALTGRRAFDGPTPEAIARAVREDEPRPVRELAPGCPRDLVAICLKALRKNPAERYETPAAFAADLRRWLNRKPTAVRPGRPFRPVWLWAVRHKGWAATIACAALAAVGLVWFDHVAAGARRRDQEVARLLLESTNLRTAAGRTDGWSARAWDKVKRAAELRPGPDVRDEAAATLIGLDAEAVKRFDESPGLTAVRCLGSHHEVLAVAFSPDGATLASAGRVKVKLWDLATGHPLIDLHSRTHDRPGNRARDRITGVTFSPDGASLAVGCVTTWEPGGVDIWHLHPGRGVRTLRGLSAQVSRLRLSADGKLLAALSHNWQVAVWDITVGKCVARLDVPPGRSVDNAGLVFSPDNRRLVYAAGEEAGEWDLETGKRIGQWLLPGGLCDQLAYHPDGRLFLFRAEWAGQVRRSPPVCRLRELCPGDGTGSVVRSARVVAEITVFPGDMEQIIASPDGRYFVAHGWTGVDGEPWMARAYDAATGRELWSGPLVDKNQAVAFGPTGAALYVWISRGREWQMVEMPVGKPVGVVRRAATDTGIWLMVNPFPVCWDNGIVSLFREDGADPIVRVSVGGRLTSVDQFFSPDGRYVVWGTETGSVLVWDVTETKRRLDGLGLGW